LKIADFGLARDYADPMIKMSCQVITRCVPHCPEEVITDFTVFYIGGIGRQSSSSVVGIIARRLIYGLLDVYLQSSCFEYRTSPERVIWIRLRPYSAL
jgi:hypothetical protein